MNEERDKVINNLGEACNSMYYYELIPAVAELEKHLKEKFGPDFTDAQFLEIVAEHIGMERCVECYANAHYYQRMKRDRYYRAAVCIECRDKAVERLFLSRQRRGIDPNNGRYKITAQQAKLRDKARHG